MNEREEKAFERIKSDLSNKEITSITYGIPAIEDLLILLNLIVKLKHDNEKQAKIIDTMAKIMAVPKDVEHLFTVKEIKERTEDVKKYFEDLVEWERGKIKK